MILFSLIFNHCVQNKNNASTLLQFCVAFALAKNCFVKNCDGELIMTALDHFVVGKLHPRYTVFENLKVVVTSFDEVHDRDCCAQLFKFTLKLYLKKHLTVDGAFCLSVVLRSKYCKNHRRKMWIQVLKIVQQK